LPNPDAIATVPPHDISDGGRAMLHELGFDAFEIEFYIAYIVDGYRLRELPERLCCSKDEVERLRASVNRKRQKLRAEVEKNDDFAYETAVFGPE
jgi:uncharacterized small protein (DUF1192 family)